MIKEKTQILSANTSLGIEFGSTRIKCVLIDNDNFLPLAYGSYTWENLYENGFWTYKEEDVIKGLRSCYADLKQDVEKKYGIILRKIGSIGVSAMMHGYLAFDEGWNLLVPYRTWRNNTTGAAADELTELFDFNVPQRWSIAHFYQSVLNNEPHLSRLHHLTTLSGYVHYLLTGKNVIGIGDASGMFPLDYCKLTYDEKMLDLLDKRLRTRNYNISVKNLLPKILKAGADAGKLTEEGAKILDASGELEAGILMCPPEGDAGTGMVATNSIAPRTGNVSAGTSIFSMVVLEKPLSDVHREIDVVSTPDGNPVAMVHCNNCTSDINAWTNIFLEFAESLGIQSSFGEIISKIFELADRGDAECGGLCSYNYVSGEQITGIEDGRPMFIRKPDSKFNIYNFARTHLYSAVASLRIGMEILYKKENINIDCLFGHGGFFKSGNIGQKIMAAALDTNISVMETAAEGGAYGMAILSAYALSPEDKLERFLNKSVFAGNKISTLAPDREAVSGFNKFLMRYKKGLGAEKTAAEID